MAEDQQLNNNTAIRGIRRAMTDNYNMFDERMNRLNGRIKDEIDEFIVETKESMPNRVDDGISQPEAIEFAKNIGKIIQVMERGFRAIKKNTLVDLDSIIGPSAYTIDPNTGRVTIHEDKISGKLATDSIGVEQKQLSMVSLEDATPLAGSPI
jgi:hypothetical protein